MMPMDEDDAEQLPIDNYEELDAKEQEAYLKKIGGYIQTYLCPTGYTFLLIVAKKAPDVKTVDMCSPGFDPPHCIRTLRNMANNLEQNLIQGN